MYLRQRFGWVTPPPQWRIRQQTSFYLPPDMIGQQRQVQTEGEPLGRAEEHHAEEEMDEVLWENQLHGAELKRKNVTPMKQQLCHRVNWSVCNVVKCQELKAELAEPPRNWLKDPGGSGRLENDSQLHRDGRGIRMSCFKRVSDQTVSTSPNYFTTLWHVKNCKIPVSTAVMHWSVWTNWVKN